MHVFWIAIALWSVLFGAFSDGLVSDYSSRPAQVTLGAILTFNSTIGRVAKIAIEEAVKDVNSNSSVLKGTKLVVDLRDSNCHTFLGTLEALQFVENDKIAIIGPQSSVVAHTISHVANNLHVPFLSFAATDPSLSSPQYPYFVRTTHSDLYQMTAVADIVKYYGWTEVVSIFVDDDYGRNGVAALEDALTARDCRIYYKAGIPLTAGTNWDNIMDVLVKVVGLESRIIVLHVYSDVGYAVLSVAQSLEMMGDGYVWIATDWLSSALDSSPSLSSDKMESMQGVLVLRQHTQDSVKKRAFTSRWKNLTGGSIRLNSYALYAYDTVWLVAQAINSFFEQGGNISFSTAPKLYTAEGNNLYLEGIKIFDGGELLLNNILHSDFIGLTGSVKFDSDRSLTGPAYDIINVFGTGFRKIGYWSNYSGLSTDSPEPFYFSHLNPSLANQKLYSVVWPGETTVTPRGWVLPNTGKQLRIGVPRRVSYKEFVSQVPGTDDFKGFCIDVFTSAVGLMTYAVPYEFVPYGDGTKNPSYSDLVDMIAAGELDGAVGDIAITTNRTKNVDFTQPYISSGLVVVAPFEVVKSSVWAFLSPFTPKMWAVTGFFVLFLGTCVWLLEHRINDEFRGTPRQQAVTILWFSVSTFYFSHRENIMSTLGRAVLLTWLFVMLVINSSYTANLSSFLTIQQLYSPIKGIESLKDGNQRIGFQVGSFAEAYLTEKIGIARSRLVALGSPEEYATALTLGHKNGGVAAVVDERPYMELFLSNHCDFEIVGQEFTKSGWGFVFPHDSPLAEDLTMGILSMSETGDLQRIHDKWLRASACSTASTEFNSDILPLRSFSGLFLVLGIAIATAVLVYYLKISILRCRKGEAAQPGTDQELSNSGSKRLRKSIPRVDDTEGKSIRDSKRRKMEKSWSHTVVLHDILAERVPKRTKSENIMAVSKKAIKSPAATPDLYVDKH